MKNLIWLSAYLIISAIFSSCSKDDENTSIIPEGEKTNVNVSLNIAPINAMETNIITVFTTDYYSIFYR